MPIIKADNIIKRYGKTLALQGVSLEIEPGRIIGVLGPNASGKTTLLKIIAGVLQPDSGGIFYPDGAARGIDSKKKIAFLPDSMSFPSWMCVKDAFKFYEDMYFDYSQEQADRMIELLDLKQALNVNVKKLSKGMQERVAIALVFSRETSVYLLDEPLGGIDPVGKAKIIDAILSMQLDNRSIIISTHLVKDVERIFDDVYFISEGKAVFSGSCEEMREQSGKTVEQAYLEVFSSYDNSI